MIEFLKSYWFELVLIIVTIASVVVSFIRKRSATSNEQVKLLIGELIPGFVNLAEASGVCGKAKLMFVIESIMKRIKCYVSSKDENYWMTYISEQVEYILSTPQKKALEVKE